MNNQLGNACARVDGVWGGPVIEKDDANEAAVVCINNKGGGGPKRHESKFGDTRICYRLERECERVRRYAISS